MKKKSISALKSVMCNQAQNILIAELITAILDFPMWMLFIRMVLAFMFSKSKEN